MKCEGFVDKECWDGYTLFIAKNVLESVEKYELVK